MVAGEYSRVNFSLLPHNRLWKAFGDSANLIPKLLPELIPSIEVLEGDGGAGTVQKFNFKHDLKHLTHVKNRIEAVDDDNRVVKFRVLEGKDIGTVLKSCVYELKMDETSEGVRRRL
ncbi:hypothetical protein H6P81_004039 [Aristolochia fimbriata]|uniref:Bet v I/Major latex protein domain-containing protein n=1 Tax=Aristolochia fimbriata TaxID=158543 RepID=A0AAV7FFC8_ARIFI|nr:hypothetical protein H6P81_004039 [Aristolochia fimbriata]